VNRKIGQKILLSGIVVSLLFITGMSSVQAQPKTIILATTTSTQDSGLLDVLLPIFEKKTGYFVKTIAVGSGHGHGPKG
jgi:tungstate transport system substrate-binding protein